MEGRRWFRERRGDMHPKHRNCRSYSWARQWWTKLKRFSGSASAPELRDCWSNSSLATHGTLELTDMMLQAAILEF